MEKISSLTTSLRTVLDFRFLQSFEFKAQEFAARPLTLVRERSTGTSRRVALVLPAKASKILDGNVDIRRDVRYVNP